MHFRKDLYFQKKNRGRHVLYCCSAHASWSPFPRKNLRFHKNNRGQGVLYYCSGYASLLPHQSDLQRRQKNRQKKSSVHSLIPSLSISRKKDIKIFPSVIIHTDPMTGIRARTITNCQLISGCRPRSAIYIQRIIRFVIMNSALFFHSHLSFNRFPSHFLHKTAPCAGTILIIS